MNRYSELQVNIFSNNRDIRRHIENSKSKKGHNFVKRNWRITSPTGMGSSFDSELFWPGRIAQSVGHLTRIWLVSQGSWVRYPVWQHTFVSPSAFSRRAVVSYWRKYEHEVLVNRLGGLSLPRKSVVRLTDRPDMTLDVYWGRKTTIQQQQQFWVSSEYLQ